MSNDFVTITVEVDLVKKFLKEPGKYMQPLVLEMASKIDQLSYEGKIEQCDIATGITTEWRDGWIELMKREKTK